MLPVQTIVTINLPTSPSVTVAKTNNEQLHADDLSFTYEDYNESFGSIFDLSDRIYSE